jgi:hypothetical protein
LTEGFQAHIKKTTRVNVTLNYTNAIAKRAGKQKVVGHGYHITAIMKFEYTE